MNIVVVVGGYFVNNSSFILIIVLACLLLLSAYFSATETAFSSLNKVRIKNSAQNGNKKARLVLTLSEDYDRILSTILIGNNIVNISSASIATMLFVKYFGEDIGVTIATIVMTILVLLFGEISPKSLAKESPEKFAMFSAPFLRKLTTILTPVNYVFMLWKKFLTLFFKTSSEKGITEEELITIVKEATKEGGINEQEGELIRSAIEFEDLNVADVLTPRIDVVSIEEKDTDSQILKVFIENGYSRLPVYRDTIDNVIGVINIKDFYQNLGNPNINIIKPITVTMEYVKLSKLLKILQNSKSQIAVVKNEYGATLGIVTLEDIIEELVGDIWDEYDEVVNEFEKVLENEYRISYRANLKRILKMFGIRKETEAASISGWVIEEIGHIPYEGDSFRYENLQVTVTKTERRRVLEIHVRIST